jgi:hypothetical protein
VSHRSKFVLTIVTCHSFGGNERLHLARPLRGRAGERQRVSRTRFRETKMNEAMFVGELFGVGIALQFQRRLPSR